MTDSTNSPLENVSRRKMLLGMGAVAGAAAGGGLLSADASAGAPLVIPTGRPLPEVLGAAIPGLTYITIDAQQFWPDKAQDRIYQDTTGSQPPTNTRIWAGLPLPVGSVIFQISVGYQTQPIIEINRRKINQSNPAVAPLQVYQKTLPLSPGGPVSATLNLTAAESTAATIEADSSYTISAFCGAGSSVFNVQIGYLPPTQSFVPFAGAEPRIFDSRLAANGGKFAANEERVVDLGIPGARSALINLTVTETLDAGFAAVFPNGIEWPKNSSINWTNTGQNIANGVITRVDATGKIKVRTNNPTHIVIDRIGFMI